MSRFKRVIIRGEQAINAFQRFYADWKAEWEGDHAARDMNAPLRSIDNIPPYDLSIEDASTPGKLVVCLSMTIWSLSNTVDMFVQNMIDHGILNYEFDLKSVIPAKPDPVVHARFK